MHGLWLREVRFLCVCGVSCTGFARHMCFLTIWGWLRVRLQSGGQLDLEEEEEQNATNIEQELRRRHVEANGPSTSE